MASKLFVVRNESLRLSSTVYQKNGVQAVMMLDRNGEEFGVLSVNLPRPPAPGCFWLKDWSENADYAEAAIQACLIELTGETQPTGFVIAKEARLL